MEKARERQREKEREKERETLMRYGARFRSWGGGRGFGFGLWALGVWISQLSTQG